MRRLLGALLLCAASTGIRAAKLADGCRHVYVDMGTNIGHQIRKLYEPSLYPGNPTELIFGSRFGADRDAVCAFGFEPNPIHTARLQLLQAHLRRRGHPATIFTETAVTLDGGNVTFYRDPPAHEANEWTASLKADRISRPGNTIPVTVSSVDISSWIKENVIGRTLGAGTLPPATVLKCDIEFMDETILTKMIFDGVFCSFTEIYAEELHLSQPWRDAIALLNSTSMPSSCRTRFTMLDDETGDDKLMPDATHPDG